MRPVSTAFQEAVRQPVREDRIEGYLGLWDSETVFRSYHFDEEHIVQGSLTITDQLPGGKFGFGGAYVRNLSIKLDLDKFGSNMNKTLVNLTDGEIMLFYYLTLEDGSEERVFLGQYFIDSEKSSRKFNVLNITALDGLSKLDTPATAMSNATVYDVYTSACAGVSDAPNTEEFFAGLPNGDKALTFDTSQIQTNRDVLMWLGELTGTFSRECRDDPPEWDRSPLFNSAAGRPELVQIPTKYTQSNTSGNFDLTAFEADNGSIIPADVRFSTDFSDTSIRVTNWKMNFNNDTLTSKISWTIAPDTLEGTIELDNNPLLSGYSTYNAQTVLDNIRDYGDDLRFCPFKTIFNGNPAIEVGDFVYLEPGGAIDETQFRHYGIVTYYKWRFRGKCELRCSTDAVASYTRPKNDGSRAATFAARDSGASANTRAKSQLEKRVDAIRRDELSFSGGSLKLAAFSPYDNTGELSYTNESGEKLLYITFNKGSVYIAIPPGSNTGRLYLGDNPSLDGHNCGISINSSVGATIRSSIGSAYIRPLSNTQFRLHSGTSANSSKYFIFDTSTGKIGYFNGSTTKWTTIGG